MSHSTKRIKGHAIICKFNNEIEETYAVFEQMDIFETLKAAKMYRDSVFTVKNGWKKGSFSREMKIIPVTISYTVPSKRKIK